MVIEERHRQGFGRVLSSLIAASVVAAFSGAGPLGGPRPDDPVEAGRFVAAATDCDNNGVDDDLQLELPGAVIAESSLTAPGPLIFSFTPNATPLVNDDVMIEIIATGDFDDPDDTVEVAMNGESLGVFFGQDLACKTRTATVVVPQKPFNEAVKAGPLNVAVTSSFSVGSDCGPNIVTIRLIMPVHADCDFNGKLDVCQIMTNPDLDMDGDGVIDLCQLDCAVDLTDNNTVNALDLAILLSQWGGPGAADFDGDGVVFENDLAMLLANWGPCP